MITHWADTSAILHQNMGEAHVAISPLTLSELEHIKTSEKDQDIKYKAREVVRKIVEENFFSVIMTDNKKIDKLLKKYSFLSDINDHRILLAAELAAIDQGRNIVFMTSDAAQYTFALQIVRLVKQPTSADCSLIGFWIRVKNLPCCIDTNMNFLMLLKSFSRISVNSSLMIML